MKQIKVTLKTITPLWTGDVSGKCNSFKITSFVGSLRWWFETLIRGMGYKACNITGTNQKDKCQFEAEDLKDILKITEKICPVCFLFGTTGWKSRFSINVLKDSLIKPYDGKVIVNLGGEKSWYYEAGLMGEIEIGFEYEEYTILKDDKELKLSHIFPSILKILLFLISEYGMLGAKTSMGYGVVKFEINGSKPVVKDNDWENFTNFLSLFDDNFKANMTNLPNLRDMFFVKFKVNKSIAEIINSMKKYYRPHTTDKWKTQNWVITSPIVRKCIRSQFSNKEIRHFLMGIGRRNSNFSAIQVSHVYSNDGNLEFRIYGWLPDIDTIKGKRDNIIDLLDNLFQSPPWNKEIPSQIQDNICWNGSLSFVNNIKKFFIYGS